MGNTGLKQLLEAAKDDVDILNVTDLARLTRRLTPEFIMPSVKLGCKW